VNELHNLLQSCYPHWVADLSAQESGTMKTSFLTRNRMDGKLFCLQTELNRRLRRITTRQAKLLGQL